MSILSIDAGTTGITVLVVSTSGAILSRGYQEFNQHFPKSGWVEHDPEEIWQATLSATTAALSGSTETPMAIGITNQRETVVLWDKDTLKSARRAIVWQDRRTSNLVVELRNSGVEASVIEKTGLGLDPYFSSTKFLWLAQKEPELWEAVKSGQVLIGTVDSYLISRISGGQFHITDASNASRTQLLNIDTGEWDEELLELFKVPRSALPEVVSSYGKLAKSDQASFLGLSIPITGVAGDQQAALFGQAAFEVGENKCTYGTGAFILSNTGANRVTSSRGLLTTIAWKEPSGKTFYALEGSVFIAGAAVQWLRDGLEIIETSPEVESLALSVKDSSGVVFVPALTGLGAPYWDPYARGTIFGLTRGTTKAHIARATLEAIAFQVRDVVDAISQDTKNALTALHVDGGAASNDLLMQLQANTLGIPVIRGKNLESTGLGAAFLAGIGSGIWSTRAELKSIFELDRTFTPVAFDQWQYVNWKRAVNISRGWAHQGEG
jgi:glycerol kinase